MKDAPKVINQFTGRYNFLSNFYPAPVRYKGLVYPSAEHAYQSAKTDDEMEKIKFTQIQLRPGEAKRMGAKLKPLRPDWDIVKLRVMYDILGIKFDNPQMRELILSTEDATLVEGNDWQDRFWGVCNGKGENHLGKLLMRVRRDIWVTRRYRALFDKKYLFGGLTVEEIAEVDALKVELETQFEDFYKPIIARLKKEVSKRATSG